MCFKSYDDDVLEGYGAELIPVSVECDCACGCTLIDCAEDYVVDHFGRIVMVFIA